MKPVFVLLIILCSQMSFSQENITVNELEKHIQFLTADSLAGRYPGTPTNETVVNYIASDFLNNGISSLVQEFEVSLKNEKNQATTWNVLGFLKGNDPHLKNETIILGAHYDHLGKKGDSIYYGADDNASGTAALLEIAEKLKANQHQLKRSVIFIAFGAEEQGLAGSKFFVENPIIPLDNIVLMVNMDMVGHLNNEKHVYMGGAGTFPGGEELMKKLGEPNGVNPIVHAGSVGGSDHVSFYRKGISVLGIHTGGHDNYHQPTDILENLNLKGEVKVCNYIYEAIMSIATSTGDMKFIPQD